MHPWCFFSPCGCALLPMGTKIRWNSPDPCEFVVKLFSLEQRNKKPPEYHLARWWLNQPVWKICERQIGSFPQGFGLNIKNIWNHHLDKIPAHMSIKTTFGSQTQTNEKIKVLNLLNVWLICQELKVVSSHEYTAWKINMEHNNGGLVQMIFLFDWVIFRCKRR